VAFPLIGVVQAGDHTIDDVTREITGRLAGAYVNDPRVSVEVLNYRPFYILGEVNKPGEYPYASGMTVDQAIAKAGGFTYRANEKTAFLRRQTSTGEHSVSLRGIGRWRSCRATRSAWGNATSDRRAPLLLAMVASSRRGRRCGLVAGQRVAGKRIGARLGAEGLGRRRQGRGPDASFSGPEGVRFLRQSARGLAGRRAQAFGPG
jgi:hypothetical protein